MGAISLSETLSRLMEKDESMSSFFKNKVVYIFSPQPWDYLQISKHHYARALAKQNQVYFVTPPNNGWWFTFSMKEIQKGLIIVRYTLPTPNFLRFKFPKVFRLVLLLYLSSLLKKRAQLADVVFDFGCYQQFESLDFIDAPYKIFFPVDELSNITHDMRGSMVVFSVSNTVLRNFSNSPAYFINHGLSDSFMRKANLALKNINSENESSTIRVGYAGNFFSRFLDSQLFMALIHENPNIEFHLFGEIPVGKVGSDKSPWLKFLHSKSNIVLHGFCDPDSLIEKYQGIDAFLICYKNDGTLRVTENSHKLMEYLSTGKVVISTYLSLYENSALIEMEMVNEVQSNFLSLFQKVISNLKYYNRAEISSARIQFAMGHSYDTNVEYIAETLEKLAKGIL